MKNKTAAFTLVELSIVLVIIGLIVGGVVGGKSLIDSSKITKTIGDFSKYRTAINAFELQYDALPGDMTDAEDYWGASNTDNGDGNQSWDDPIVEGLLVWQHLGLSKIIPQQYAGPSSQYSTGVSLPASAFGTRWHALKTTKTSYGVTYINGNSIKIANGDNNVHWCAGVPIEATLAIEKKMDDGSPVSGKIVAGNPCGSEMACINNNKYIKSSTGMGCQLILKLY